MKIKRLTVFCGSKPGNNPLYIQHAARLGHILAERGITLVYGGGNKGMMGAIANAVLKEGGSVTGIMPHILAGIEHSHPGLTEMIEVEDMHTRKKLLYEKGDAALILPGGFGTMDEFFEMLTWNQLHIHSKKIIIMNTEGFYDSLIGFLTKIQEENFLYDQLSERIIIVSSPDEIEFD
ncbi:MAG: TIGR00730 family Rossman fold protein [Chitinophagaceae bacterium]|nr:TIGR00730 family Rossman fold protein [Chitinophagaceae bacterium]